MFDWPDLFLKNSWDKSQHCRRVGLEQWPGGRVNCVSTIDAASLGKEGQGV